MSEQDYVDYVRMAKGAASKATQAAGDGPVPAEERLAAAGAAQTYGSLALAEAIRMATEAFVNR